MSTVIRIQRYIYLESRLVFYWVVADHWLWEGSDLYILKEGFIISCQASRLISPIEVWATSSGLILVYRNNKFYAVDSLRAHLFWQGVYQCRWLGSDQLLDVISPLMQAISPSCEIHSNTSSSDDNVDATSLLRLFTGPTRNIYFHSFLIV